MLPGSPRLTVAVVDTGAPPRFGPNAHTCAAAIARAAGVHARVLRGDPRDPALDEPLGGVDVLVLPEADLSEAQALRERGAVPVLTCRETAAVALVARSLSALARRGRPARVSRVVLAGASVLPELAALLVAAGFRDLTTWDRRDARLFPLEEIAARAHVILDLVGEWTPRPREPRSRDPLVIAVDWATDPLVALPGMVEALAGTPGAQPHTAVLAASALAVVMATEPERDLPSMDPATLAGRIADSATSALRSRRRSTG